MKAIAACTESGLIERILGEYREMPGLALTMVQAEKLWGCDAQTCRCVMQRLLDQGILRWSRNDRLVRGE